MEDIIKLKMEDLIGSRAERIYKADVLFGKIEEVTGVSKETIISKNRTQNIALARNIAGYMLYMDIGMTTTDTAKILKRDHSTVVYYGRMFNTNYNYWAEYKNTYDTVSKSFWDELVVDEKEEIDLRVKSLESLIEKLKERKQLFNN